MLRKGVYLELDRSGQPVSLRDESTEIQWKEGGNLLVELRKEAASSEEGSRKRYRKCPSFFRFFTSAERPEDATNGRSKVRS